MADFSNYFCRYGTKHLSVVTPRSTKQSNTLILQCYYCLLHMPSVSDTHNRVRDREREKAICFAITEMLRKTQDETRIRTHLCSNPFVARESNMKRVHRTILKIFVFEHVPSFVHFFSLSFHLLFLIGFWNSGFIVNRLFFSGKGNELSS